MLPNTIVGTVITGSGAVPFKIDTATGAVTTGSYTAADSMQRSMGGMESSAVEKQVRAKVSGASKVRIGEYQCPKCSRWVNVVKKPGDWSGDTCSKC